MYNLVYSSKLRLVIWGVVSIVFLCPFAGWCDGTARSSCVALQEDQVSRTVLAAPLLCKSNGERSQNRAELAKDFVEQTQDRRELFEAIEEAIYRENADVVQDLIIALCSDADMLSKLGFQELLHLAVYMRYADNWNVPRRRWLDKTIEQSLRYCISSQSCKIPRLALVSQPLGPDQQALFLRTIERILVDQFNENPEVLKKELLHHVDEATVIQILIVFSDLKFEMEEYMERLAFAINHRLVKQEVAHNPSSTETKNLCRVRDILSGERISLEWFKNQLLEKRLTLVDKLRIVEKYVEGSGQNLVTEPVIMEEMQLKLAVAKVHFKDRYDIDLVVPLEGKVPADQVPRDINGNKATLIKEHEIIPLLSHLVNIDQHLGVIPYEITGFNRELRQVVVVHDMRARYTDESTGREKDKPVSKMSHMVIAVPVEEKLDMPMKRRKYKHQPYIDVLLHEFGHSVGNYRFGVPFLYSPAKLSKWLETYGCKGRLNQVQSTALDELMLNEKEGGAWSSEMQQQASLLMYDVISLVFQEFQERYEQKLEALIKELNTWPLEDIRQKLYLVTNTVRPGTLEVEEAPVEKSLQVIERYILGDEERDRSGLLQTFLQESTTLKEKLCQCKDVEADLWEIQYYLEKSILGELTGESINMLLRAEDFGLEFPSFDYICKVPKGDHDVRVIGDTKVKRYRKHANEFVAEFFSFFMQHEVACMLRAHSAARVPFGALQPVRELFRLFIGGTKFSRSNFPQWITDETYREPVNDHSDAMVVLAGEIMGRMDLLDILYMDDMLEELSDEEYEVLEAELERMKVVLTSRVMDILVRVLRGASIETVALEQDLYALLKNELVPFDDRLFIAGKIAELLNTLSALRGSGNQLQMSQAMEAEVDLFLQGMINRAIDDSDHDTRTLDELFRCGIHLLSWDPCIDLGGMRDVEGDDFARIVRAIARRMKVDTEVIVALFKPKYFAGNQVRILPEQPAKSPKLKPLTGPVIMVEHCEKAA